MKQYVVLWVVGMLLTVVYSVMVTPFVWLGWNHGIARALWLAREISIVQAFFVCLALANISNLFKASLALTLKD